MATLQSADDALVAVLRKLDGHDLGLQVRRLYDVRNAETQDLARTRTSARRQRMGAERFSMTRGALYTTVHDARRKLRTHLSDAGMALEQRAAA